MHCQADYSGCQPYDSRFQPNYRLLSWLGASVYGTIGASSNRALSNLEPGDASIWRHTMKLPRRTFLKFAAASVAAPAFPRIATAGTYPSRPITMVVPFP